jgi:hypothetical protein
MSTLTSPHFSHRHAFGSGKVRENQGFRPSPESLAFGGVRNDC